MRGCHKQSRPGCRRPEDLYNSAAIVPCSHNAVTLSTPSRMTEKYLETPERSNLDLDLSSGKPTKRPSSCEEVRKSHESIIVSVRRRPKAVLWCCSAIWILFVSAYTNTAGNSILGIPQFRHDFGHLVNGRFVLPAEWQTAFFGGGFAA